MIFTCVSDSAPEFPCPLAPISFGFCNDNMPQGYRRIDVFFNAYLSCFRSYLSIRIIQLCKRQSGGPPLGRQDQSQRKNVVHSKVQLNCFPVPLIQLFMEKYMHVYMYTCKDYRSHSVPSVFLQPLQRKILSKVYGHRQKFL